jgi:GGGtGRT protein
MALFESYDRRIAQIEKVLAQYGIANLDEAKKLSMDLGVDVATIVKGIQPIAFENACWAYIVGAAIAIKKGQKKAVDIALSLGEGMQSFCISGSVADDRKVGLGHGNLASMLLKEETKCFAFLAGHESFAAAEGAIGLARSANKARTTPLRVILNGLGKDAAQIISRINGFTYVQTKFDYATGQVNIVKEIAYSNGEKAKVRCYGADDVREGVAILHSEGVDVSITGNSTNPTRFQHPVAGTYKKECVEQGKKYFSVASGGGTGRTLHPDNMAAGPASYGMTDTMGRMHSDAQFAGSSSVPAHVEMMGFIGSRAFPAEKGLVLWTGPFSRTAYAGHGSIHDPCRSGNLRGAGGPGARQPSGGAAGRDLESGDRRERASLPGRTPPGRHRLWRRSLRAVPRRAPHPAQYGLR